jgi:hypothetical protein
MLAFLFYDAMNVKRSEWVNGQFSSLKLSMRFNTGIRVPYSNINASSADISMWLVCGAKLAWLMMSLACSHK